MIKCLTRNITLWLSIIAVAISSVAQFHHHTDGGHINIIYNTIIQAALNSASEQCDEHDAVPQSGQKECSFKLSYITHLNNEGSNVVPSVALHIIGINPNVLDIGLLEQTIASNNIFHYSNLLIHLYKVGTSGLRSPPCNS